MEQLEDLFVETITNANIQNNPDAMNHMMQGMNDSMQQFHHGKSPVEIAEMTNTAHNFMTKILNRANVPVETKLISEREFLFYKLADDKDFCPKLRSWKRQDGQFLITYKKHDPIDILTEDKKELVIKLINQLHGMGIILNNLTKNSIVYNEYEGIKLTGFSEASWVDTINDEQFLLNNSYGPCSTIEELLALELKIIDDIFETDSKIDLDNEITLYLKPKVIDNHFHSSDEENVYY